MTSLIDQPTRIAEPLAWQWRSSTAVERFAYGVGALLIVSGLAHLAILLSSGASWSGPLSWRKPMTFGLSFGITLVTITWVSTLVDLQARARTVLIAAFTFACTSETVLVTLQTWRGRPSHFNVETPVDALIARALATGGAMLVVVIVSLTIAAFRSRPGRTPSLLVAIRAGFAALLAAQLAGIVMIVRGMQLVFRGDPQAAYASGGFLKSTHAVLMHGIFLLPALAWLLRFVDWPEERRQAVVLAVTVGYVLLVGAVAITDLR